MSSVSSKTSLAAHASGSSLDSILPPGAFHFPWPKSPLDFLSRKTSLSLSMKQRVACIVKDGNSSGGFLLLKNDNDSGHIVYLFDLHAHALHHSVGFSRIDSALHGGTINRL